MNSKIQVRYYVFYKGWDLKLQDELKQVFLNTCSPFSPFENEVIRIAFFHPNFEKAELFDIKNIVTLKFRLFYQGKENKELDKENVNIDIYSIPFDFVGCCKVNYFVDTGEYNQINEIKLLPFITSHGDFRSNNWNNIYISRLLKDPTIFLYIRCVKPVGDGLIEISDEDNFELIKTTNPLELYAGSKLFRFADKFIENKKLKFLSKKIKNEMPTLSNNCIKCKKFKESIYENFSINHKDDPPVTHGFTKCIGKSCEEMEKEFEENLDKSSNEVYRKLKSIENELEKY